MSNLWWRNHRLLTRGAKGADVERVQRGLNDMGASPRLDPDGDFGSRTETAVRAFQGIMNLVVDGKVGPVTHSVLLAGSYRFELRRPPFVSQGSIHLCWAASLESVLRRAWPGRPRSTVADLRRRYGAHLSSKGAISPAALRRPVGTDLRFREVLVGKLVRAEHLFRLLGQKKPLLMVDNSTGGVRHTRVLYGVRIRGGAIDLMLMDPMRGHTLVPIGNIQSLKVKAFLAPSEVHP